MEIKELQDKVDKLIEKHGGYWSPLSMLARLVEEVGELSKAMNVKFGDKKSKFNGDEKELEKEVADIIIALTAISNYLKIDLDKSLNEKMEGDVKRNKGLYY